MGKVTFGYCGNCGEEHQLSDELGPLRCPLDKEILPMEKLDGAASGGLIEKRTTE